MKLFLKKLPLPICGLILGIASLGNLFKAIGLPVVGNAWGVLALILILLVVAKIVIHFKSSLADLNDPVIASVAPTFTMSLMIISTFLKAWGLPILPIVVWTVAVGLQFVIMGYFVYQHLLRPSVELNHVLPSWFVTFVGIGVIPVTSNNFIPAVGMPVLWLSLGLYAILLPIVCIRLLRREMMFEATLPLLTIMAAPASLCLTGYLTITQNPSWVFALIMVGLAQTLYWGTLLKIFKYVRMSFYPSFGAFTFPLVISATALNLFNHSFHLANGFNAIIGAVANLEITLATFMVVFVVIRYGQFLVKLAFPSHETKKVTAAENETITK
ncbi:TDT family transporter [Lentilactobacillus parafarraginis]|jgi:exfoliative toxin A/B|uniref:C4-dicarboxylate transporter malic acid transport protein n=2 Tax=Lentilactobacillus parafarraginis TaxID=390842 RepID=A0A0R1Z444_9LACO|nr:TDT family transporter [Lentilactobacillus parafarraginis]KRM45747.1 C4-dicarboxylate transporter malic acid transport protein [Lentilactobacillus parafarraginis DSM 18390 = JCM 14109]TLQ20744.1 TDT family transporter [Lentilactobacillus parafarraginis]